MKSAFAMKADITLDIKLSNSGKKTKQWFATRALFFFDSVNVLLTIKDGAESKSVLLFCLQPL